MTAGPLLSMEGVEKSYGAVRAVQGADLRVTGAGRVHALMGQNGCGKSTMLGILSGQLRPDAGTVTLEGEEVRFRDPAQAVRQGISMVSQETTLAEDLSVTENILLGRLQRTITGIDWGASHEKAASVLAGLGLSYDPRSIVRGLRPDQRQMVEIARAISTEPRLLILDEPTSSLADDQVESLLETVRTMTADGISVLFVSHRLPEVFELCDEVTVMRDGRTVSAGPLADYTPESIVAQMVGEEGRSEDEPRRTAGAEGTGTLAPVLAVHGLSREPYFSGVSLEVRPGEILGLAGLSGSGCSEVLQTVFGLEEADRGEVAVDGEAFTGRSPRAAIAAGMGYVPPDRKTQGLLLDVAAQDNLTTVATHGLRRWQPQRRSSERRTAVASAGKVGLRQAVLPFPPRSLSGGNQQKVLLGKWLANHPKVLMLDEPTRGVDVAAKAEIHRRLREAADAGLAVIVTSSEVDELIELCEEIIIMFRGRATVRLAGTEVTEAAIAEAAGGHT